MSVQLLDKTRKINKLLHNNNTQKVVFNDICNVLSDILDSNILVIISANLLPISFLAVYVSRSKINSSSC